MKRLLIILALYLACTAGWGIAHTASVLRADASGPGMENPRVNLLCSYWYEGFNYREVMSLVCGTVSVGVTDKLATGIYGAMYGIEFSDSCDYVLSAYPIPGAQRVSLKPGFMNLYRRVTP
jgi:hypothetical protein